MDKLLKSNRTIIVGILNVTPDSFSDGGLYYNDMEKIVGRVKEMLAEGADVIDIGGESTRPGAIKVPLKEELRRVVPVITEVRKQLGYDFPISVDTYKSVVADDVLKAGATMINSLGGFVFDKKIIHVAKQHQCPIVMYHIKGEPQTMQQGEIHYDDVVGDIMKFFQETIQEGVAHGLKHSQFILDPGIGFGKTVEQTIEIINRLEEFKKLNLPLMIGVSRKSHLGMILKNELHLSEVPSTHERIEGALAETGIVVTNGARFIRTHDVLPTKKFLCVLDTFRK